jgi:hypothetical protein
MKPILVDAQLGSLIISEQDDYIKNFSKFDMQSRLGTQEQVSIKDLTVYLSHQTLDWTDYEVKTVIKIFEELEESLSIYKKYLPEKVKFIKTTGRDECEAAYTRKDCIYIPLSMIRWSYNELKELIAHELFHIVSTYNPEFRKKWYSKLGFTTCPDLEIPIEYKDLYVSNPDTIGKNCYVKFQENGKEIKAIPFLYSDNPYRGGYFFHYFRFAFLAIQNSNGKCIPIYNGIDLKFIETPQKLYDLCLEIDPYNNQHRLHPEEILAYYWNLLPFSESELEHNRRTFLQKIRNILQNERNIFK